MSEFSPVKETVYGIPEKDSGLSTPKKECLIVCPHGDGGEEFLETFPEVRDALYNAHDKNAFDRYIAVEQDFGTSELARAIGISLEEAMHPVKTTVLEVQFPRGILDVNRASHQAIRNIFPDSNEKEKIKRELQELYERTIRTIKDHVNTLIGNNGVLLDLHSMAPVSPEAWVAPETPNSLASYTASYANAHKPYGARRRLRPVDVVTETRKEDGTADPIGHTRFASLIKDELQTQRDIPVGYNNPYPARPGMLTDYFLRTARGIAVDVPKHLLASGPAPTHDDFDLAGLQIDGTKLDRISFAIANAIRRCLASPL